MSPNHARKLTPISCDAPTVAACMRRMGNIEQSIRELTEAVVRNTESTERRNQALISLERRLSVGAVSE